MFKDDAKFHFIIVSIMSLCLIIFVLYFHFSSSLTTDEEILLDYQYYAKENVKKYLSNKYGVTPQLLKIEILEDLEDSENKYKRESIVSSTLNGIKFDTYFIWNENKTEFTYYDDYQYNEIYNKIKEELFLLTNKEFNDLTITFYENKEDLLNYETKNKLTKYFNEFTDNTFYKLDISVTYNDISKINSTKLSKDSILYKSYTSLNIYKLINNDLVKMGDILN